MTPEEKESMFALLDAAHNEWEEAQALKKGGVEAVLTLRREKAEAAARAKHEANQTDIGRLAKERLAKLEKARKEGGDAGYLAMLRQLEEEERQAEQARRDAEQEAADQALKDADEAALKAEALGAWRANGGDEATFEKEWPTLRAEVLRRKTLAAVANTDAKPRQVYYLDF